MKKIISIIILLGYFYVANAQSPHDARLYGMTQYGSYNTKGSIFHYTPSTNTFTNDYNFQIKVKGRTPKCEIVTGNNGKYYGTTTAGGDYNAGVLFEWDSVTSVYKDLHNFTGSNGKDARGGMVLYNNKLYGMTNEGGAFNFGVIFEYDITTNIYTKKVDMDSINGKNPDGSLLLVGNKFLGFTHDGGINDKGVLFEWNPATNIYTKKYDFDSINGSNPVGKLAEYNGKLYAMTNTGGANNVGVIYEWNYNTDSYNKKIDFNNTNGAFPMGYLTLYNNKFYGTTYEGGIYQAIGQGHFGVIFEYNPTNNMFVKKKDLGFNGGMRGPLGSLTLKGNVFWSAVSNGIFSWNPATNLFVGKYGFSSASACELERHAIGTEQFESLFLSGDYLLGSASEGAGSFFGTLYKFYPDSNQITALVNMEATDGSYPKGSLSKLGNKLYGLTYQGGNNHAGNIFEWDLTTQQFKERFQLDGLKTGVGPKGSLTYYNGKLYGINTYGKLIAGNTSFNQRDPGDYFSWDPVSNQYQSLLSANYARCTPVLFNSKLYTITESSSIPMYSAINVFDPANNTLTEVATMDPNVGTFNNYQDYVSANGLTYYNGKFYGMTPAKYHSGATPFRGAIYEWDTTTTTVTHRYDFVDSLGTYPTGNLLLVGNEFYGLTSNIGNYSPTYPSLFKWNPATNVLERKGSFNGAFYGTPVYSGGKIYFLSESSYLDLYEYDPILDTTIIVYSEPIPLFQVGGNWNYTNCTRPPSYQQLLEVIPNQDPVLSNIPTAQTVCSNQINTATFTINDADLDTMSFQITSSNPTLIPVANISITNVGSIYTITYSSINNQAGAATLSLIADDGYGGSVNFSFLVNVNPSPNIGVTLSLPTLTSQENSALSYQWIDCNSNTAIIGETNQSYTATTNGSYAVVVNNTSCSDTSQCFIVTTVGVNEYILSNSISIFPNPSNDFITISKNNTSKTEIEIYNIVGNLIYKTILIKQQTTIDLSKEANGIYFIKITDENQNVTNRKIVIE
jgi:uncharacterized repeat protein (TIGR03803 family)